MLMGKGLGKLEYGTLLQLNVDGKLELHVILTRLCFQHFGVLTLRKLQLTSTVSLFIRGRVRYRKQSH